jgi:hypothetical protein
MPRATISAGIAASLLAMSVCAACGGVDAIEYEPDSENVQRVRPSWQEPGAQAPVPTVPAIDSGVDAAAPESDAGVDGGSDAGPVDGTDAGADASTDSGTT